MNKNIIIAGGGTFGHIRPALTIKNWLEDIGFNVFYSCAERDKKFPFFHKEKNIFPIKLTGLPRTKNIFKLILFFFKLFSAIFKAFLILLKIKPTIIITTGGFVSFPYLLLAKIFRKPYFIFEQNSIPGLANRLFFKSAKKVFLSIPLKGYENLTNFILSGNPINVKVYNKEDAAKILGIDFYDNKKYILVFGGSQGAKTINNIFLSNIESLKKLSDYMFILVTGDDTKVVDENIITFKFIEDMGAAYSLSDFIISRAGASTVSEVIYFQKPTIFIPYPYATENHQFYNAKFALENINGIIIDEKDINFDIIINSLKKLDNTEKIIVNKYDTKKIVIDEVLKWI
ncbi:MAG TPA: UDP-N-acetylglucosamine--N-acetylmuramyl-(pentapeptide) pyrophosphoryl-undecaprenol N-acetylglucosamine transferase [Spirochaetota bacterium]|nr:UDP-N-acetylglucosamine--N-acetylmuramyl-(pentapeptide) pyrophosphoryl-undecaprenol N-acetylglucosamine transferase [Spirochaetota bacterium]HOM39032.1 UDP-N-acetylglucosamine--N-acetylmuramyl-(pentapeptide) pyrophosphoryl-undecaprenol N-acetylglucosamine transferase [Spirochaetota bacterium]HPQ49915.1 UDP-N-acetylglucosamine--N-acetylmuramyl-(pentapeptide) pyrophosphoryl-undecaprenol N-acetylglucosamine transferase [Spirochaetota bacterium]